jgi:uncharacterized OB-fold protein
MKAPKIYSYTILHSAAVEFADRTPYACAIIEDTDGKRASCILDGYKPGAAIAVGMPVTEITGADGVTGFQLVS